MATRKEQQQHMSDHPHLQKIWVDENGDWLHHAHTKFPVELSRDQVMSDEYLEEKKEKTKTQSKK